MEVKTTTRSVMALRELADRIEGGALGNRVAAEINAALSNPGGYVDEDDADRLLTLILDEKA